MRNVEEPVSHVTADLWWLGVPVFFIPYTKLRRAAREAEQPEWGITEVGSGTQSLFLVFERAFNWCLYGSLF